MHTPVIIFLVFAGVIVLAGFLAGLESGTKSSLLGAGIVLFLVFVLYLLPIMGACGICRQRNRSMLKGFVVTCFTGWIGFVLLWLGLKTRDPERKVLY